MSAKVKIYEMVHSPYCLPITQALTALGVGYESIPIPNWDRGLVIRLTGGAYYQVPVLVHGEKIVYESTVQSIDVARYVDRVFGEGRLFPAETSGLQEILVQHIENEVEGVTFKLCDIHYIPAIENLTERTMTIRHKERSFGRGCVDAWRAEASKLRIELDCHLERFDRTLRHRPFLLGEVPQYVDFALFGVIGNYTYRGYNELSSDHTSLSDWRERLVNFRFAPLT